MEQALRPHRGGTVLALGILSIVLIPVFVPLGILAWILGSRDLRRMNRGEVDPAGRTLTQIGWVFGVVASILFLGSAGCAALVFSGYRISNSFEENGTARTTKLGFTIGPFSSGSQAADFEYEYHEVIDAEGDWVKDGEYKRWNRAGRVIEQGTYRADERDGHWTFWNGDGSVDQERSGLYENDELVQAGAETPQ